MVMQALLFTSWQEID